MTGNLKQKISWEILYDWKFKTKNIVRDIVWLKIKKKISWEILYDWKFKKKTCISQLRTKINVYQFSDLNTVITRKLNEVRSISFARNFLEVLLDVSAAQLHYI